MTRHDRAELRLRALRWLQRAKSADSGFDAAVARFVFSITNPENLVVALMGETEVRAAAMQYMRRLAAEVGGQIKSEPHHNDAADLPDDADAVGHESDVPQVYGAPPPRPRCKGDQPMTDRNDALNLRAAKLDIIHYVEASMQHRVPQETLEDIDVLLYRWAAAAGLTSPTVTITGPLLKPHDDKDVEDLIAGKK